MLLSGGSLPLLGLHWYAPCVAQGIAHVCARAQRGLDFSSGYGLAKIVALAI